MYIKKCQNIILKIFISLKAIKVLLFIASMFENLELQ